MAVPRDRNGEFEPQIIQKRQNKTTGDLEEKVLSMYAKGMTTEDISRHLDDIYGVDVSDSMISRITDKIMPVVREWQTRRLEEVYAIVYLDAIHFHVRHEGTVIKKAVYIALGINMEGYKRFAQSFIRLMPLRASIGSLERSPNLRPSSPLMTVC